MFGKETHVRSHDPGKEQKPPSPPPLLLTIKETTILTFMASHCTVPLIALLAADP